VHLGDALVANKKLIVRSWVREHSLHFIASLKADGAAASVVGSNRFRGLGTPLGNFKVLEGAVPLARHARDSLDHFFVLPSSAACSSSGNGLLGCESSLADCVSLARLRRM
jgi:hypothetical protein